MERALHRGPRHDRFSGFAGPIIRFAHDVRNGFQTRTELMLAPSQAYAPLNEGSSGITVTGTEVLRLADTAQKAGILYDGLRLPRNRHIKIRLDFEQALERLIFMRQGLIDVFI